MKNKSNSFKYEGVLFIIGEPLIEGILPQCVVRAIPCNDTDISKGKLLNIIHHSSPYVSLKISEYLETWCLMSIPDIFQSCTNIKEFTLIYTIYHAKTIRDCIIHEIDEIQPPILDTNFYFTFGMTSNAGCKSLHPAIAQVYYYRNLSYDDKGQLPEFVVVLKIYDIDTEQVRDNDPKKFNDFFKSVQSTIYDLMESSVVGLKTIFHIWRYILYTNYDDNSIEFVYKLLLHKIGHARITKMTSNVIDIYDTTGWDTVHGSLSEFITSNIDNSYITVSDLYPLLFSNPLSRSYAIPLAIAPNLRCGIDGSNAIRTTVKLANVVFRPGLYTEIYVAYKLIETITCDDENTIEVFNMNACEQSIRDYIKNLDIVLSIPYYVKDGIITIPDSVIDRLKNYNSREDIKGWHVFFNCRIEERLYIFNTDRKQTPIRTDVVENPTIQQKVDKKYEKEISDDINKDDDTKLTVSNPSMIQTMDKEGEKTCNNTLSKKADYIKAFISKFKHKKE